MTNKMRTILLMDAIRRHRDATDNHCGDCCVQARLAAQEMVNQAEEAEKQAAVAAPVSTRAPEPSRTVLPPVLAPARPARDQIANPRQIRYIADLLELKDVPNHWRRAARELILQDYPSYAEAKRILSQLTAMKDLPGAVRMATPPMVRLLNRLLNQKQWPVEVDPKTLSFKDASTLIDALFKAEDKPRAGRAVPSAEDSIALPDEGMYLFEGSYYKIQIDVHGNGRKMCKKLYPGKTVDGEKEKGVFRKFTGMGGKLTAEHRLSLEQAKEFGKLYGQCVCCGAVLTKEESIDKGIGPVCEGNWF